MYKKRRSGGMARISFQSRSEVIYGSDSSTEKRIVKASILRHQSLLQALLKNTSCKHNSRISY